MYDHILESVVQEIQKSVDILKMISASDQNIFVYMM